MIFFLEQLPGSVRAIKDAYFFLLRSLEVKA